MSASQLIPFFVILGIAVAFLCFWHLSIQYSRTLSGSVQEMLSQKNVTLSSKGVVYGTRARSNESVLNKLQKAFYSIWTDRNGTNEAEKDK